MYTESSSIIDQDRLKEFEGCKVIEKCDNSFQGSAGIMWNLAIIWNSYSLSWVYALSLSMTIMTAQSLGKGGGQLCTFP